MKTISAELEPGVTVTAPEDRALRALLRELAHPPMVGLQAHVFDIPVVYRPWMKYGDSAPGYGGRFGGRFPGRNGGKDYLLFIPDLSSAPRLEFGGRGKTVKGADSNDDGAANTAALLSSGIDHPAAKFCANFEFEGHKDYYLMARNEARFLSMTVPQLFDASAYHWTSTRGSSDFAFVQDFSGGDQDYGGLVNEILVRPVRREFIP